VNYYNYFIMKLMLFVYIEFRMFNAEVLKRMHFLMNVCLHGFRVATITAANNINKLYVLRGRLEGCHCLPWPCTGALSSRRGSMKAALDTG